MKKIATLVAFLTILACSLAMSGSAQATVQEDVTMYNVTNQTYCETSPGFCQMFKHPPNLGYSFDGSPNHWGETYYTQVDGFIYILAWTKAGGTGCAVGTWCVWFRGQGPGPHGPYCMATSCNNPPYGVAGWKKVSLRPDAALLDARPRPKAHAASYDGCLNNALPKAYAHPYAGASGQQYPVVSSSPGGVIPPYVYVNVGIRLSNGAVVGHKQVYGCDVAGSVAYYLGYVD